MIEKIKDIYIYIDEAGTLVKTDENNITEMQQLWNTFEFYRTTSLITRSSSEDDIYYPPSWGDGGAGGISPGWGGGSASGPGGHGGTGYDDDEKPVYEIQVSASNCVVGGRYYAKIVRYGGSNIVKHTEAKLYVSRASAIGSGVLLTEVGYDGVEAYFDMPGEIKIWADVKYTLRDPNYTTAPIQAEVAPYYINVRFPSRSDVLYAPGIMSAMHQAWAMTVSSCTATYGVEYIYAINLHINRGQVNYSLDFIDSVESNYIKDASWTAQVWDIPVGVPGETGQYCVGIFHTHPPLHKAELSNDHYRAVGPSEEDKSNSCASKYPCFVYDVIASKNGNTYVEDKSTSGEIYNYGAETRTYY